jgi:hypothetical protein
MRRVEREQMMVRAWVRAEEERRVLASRSWPHDPWRGGFGPPSGSVELGNGGRRGREREVQRPKTSGGGVQVVKVWLKKVTSLERLRA